MVRLRGYRLKLRPRFAELLVALALHPDGLTGEQLALCAPTCLENDLSLQVFGSEGSLSWRQKEPNTLVFRPARGPQQHLTRGSPQLTPSALAASRLPSRHLEGFLGAFASIYRGVAEAMFARQEGWAVNPDIAQFPDLMEELGGVQMIKDTVRSARSHENGCLEAWSLRLCDGPPRLAPGMPEQGSVRNVLRFALL